MDFSPVNSSQHQSTNTKTRLRFFNDYMQTQNGEGFRLQDLSVEDGRNYIRFLMEKNTLYQNHPMHLEKDGKLKVQCPKPFRNRCRKRKSRRF